VVGAVAGAAEAAARFRRYIERPVLTGIDVRFEGFDAHDVEPMSVPDLLSERPLVVFGKYRGRPKGIIAVTGRGGNGKYSELVKVGEYAPRAGNSALRYLWARHRIQLLADYNSLAEDSARIREVTRLGLQYSLLTAYTSFVAIDSKVRNKDGDPTQVIQPLPLPQGVSDCAVGGASGSGLVGKSAAPASNWTGLKKTESRATAQTVAPLTATEVESGEFDRSMFASVALAEARAADAPAGATLRLDLEALLPELEAEYRNALAATPGRKGSLTLTFSLGPDGKATDVRVTASGLPRALAQRLDALVKAARFVVPNSAVKVTARFEFTTGS
jgi:Ca-activated chloride channel family protein